jgi:hypothetical protein
MVTGAGIINPMYMCKEPATGQIQDKVSHMWQVVGRQLNVENHGQRAIGKNKPASPIAVAGNYVENP